MRLHRLFGIALGALALAAASSARAEIVTLQNDGLGSLLAGTASCGFIEGEYVAAVFRPAEEMYPVQILQVQFPLAPVTAGLVTCNPTTEASGLSFPLRIWVQESETDANPPAEAFYEDLGLTLSSSMTVFNTIDLSTEDLIVEGGEGIRVAFEHPAGGVAFPYRDTGITAYRNLVYGVFGADMLWQWSDSLMVPGDWVMRLVVDTNVGTTDTDADTDTDTDTDSDTDTDTDTDTDSDTDSDSDADTDTECDPVVCNDMCENNGFQEGACGLDGCVCIEGDDGGRSDPGCGCTPVGDRAPAVSLLGRLARFIFADPS